MKRIIVALLVMIELSWGEQWYQAGNPFFLGTHNFRQKIEQQGGYKIVKFFTPWCKYCRTMKNTFESLRNENNYNLQFYQINCDQQLQLCFQQSVRSFPYIKLFGLKGEIVQSIQGNYPKHIIANILDKYKKVETQNAQQLQSQKQQGQKPSSLQVTPQSAIPKQQKVEQQIKPSVQKEQIVQQGRPLIQQETKIPVVSQTQKQVQEGQQDSMHMKTAEQDQARIEGLESNNNQTQGQAESKQEAKGKHMLLYLGAIIFVVVWGMRHIWYGNLKQQPNQQQKVLIPKGKPRSESNSKIQTKSSPLPAKDHIFEETLVIADEDL